MTTPATNKFLDLINGDKPVLVDFSAEWCGPCQQMPPILQEVKKSLGDHLSVIKIDIDKSSQTAASFKIQSVPTLMLFSRGKVKWRQSGVVPAHQLIETLRQLT